MNVEVLDCVDGKVEDWTEKSKRPTEVDVGKNGSSFVCHSGQSANKRGVSVLN